MSLDEQCIAALGWVRADDPPFRPCPYWHDAEGNCTKTCVEDDYDFGDAFSPSTRMDDARCLEDDIKARGLGAAYARRLFALVGGAEYDVTLFDEGGHMDGNDLFLLIRATPEQRCRAYLKARGLT